MPGSRKSEIQKLLPVFKELIKNIPNKEHILIIPAGFDRKFIDEVYGDISGFKISNNTHKTLFESEFAFICSGTATLEAAIIGTPFTLAYIAKPLDYFIGKKLVKVPFIGLANIFFNKMREDALHKEFLQENVTVENLLNEYNSLNREIFLTNSSKLRDYLQNGSSKKVACIIEDK